MKKKTAGTLFGAMMNPHLFCARIFSSINPTEKAAKYAHMFIPFFVVIRETEKNPLDFVVKSRGTRINEVSQFCCCFSQLLFWTVYWVS